MARILRVPVLRSDLRRWRGLLAANHQAVLDGVMTDDGPKFDRYPETKKLAEMLEREMELMQRYLRHA